MRIELRERIKTTDEEFNSVKKNTRLTLSEKLHGNPRTGLKRGPKRASFDPLTEDFTIQSQDVFND